MPSAPHVSAAPAVAGTVALLAQEQPPARRGPGEFLVQTLPIALIVLAAYMLLFRPEREKLRRQQALLAGLKKNDRVVTSAGIYGTVAAVDRDGDRVTLKIDDDARITVTLASVARVLGDKADGAEPAAP